MPGARPAILRCRDDYRHEESAATGSTSALIRMPITFCHSHFSLLPRRQPPQHKHRGQLCVYEAIAFADAPSSMPLECLRLRDGDRFRFAFDYYAAGVAAPCRHHDGGLALMAVIFDAARSISPTFTADSPAAALFCPARLFRFTPTPRMMGRRALATLFTASSRALFVPRMNTTIKVTH